MKKAVAFATLVGLSSLAEATPRTSSSYTLAPEAVVPGGTAASATYRLESSVDPGGAAASSARFTHRSGFVGQLYDLTGLEITPVASSVAEGDPNQLEAAARLDDGTTLALDPSLLAWSVVGGPVSFIDASGLARTAPTFADLPGEVRGEYLALVGTASFLVRDVTADDVPPVAGDGVDDAWQFENFDADHDGHLDAVEGARAAPDANPDRDPNSNLVEWLSGFDPNDSAAFFRWDITSRAGTDLEVVANRVIPGTLFRLQSTTDPEAGPWVTVDSVLPNGEVTDQRFSDPNATGSERYYRLTLEKSP